MKGGGRERERELRDRLTVGEGERGVWGREGADGWREGEKERRK